MHVGLLLDGLVVGAALGFLLGDLVVGAALGFLLGDEVLKVGDAEGLIFWRPTRISERSDLTGLGWAS